MTQELTKSMGGEEEIAWSLGGARKMTRIADLDLGGKVMSQ